MSNLFEAIRESMKDPVHAQNEATAKRLRELHTLYRDIDAFARPIIDQFSKAIGAESYVGIVDDDQFLTKIESVSAEEQIQILTGEEPLWVITNQNPYLGLKYCSNEMSRILLLRWDGTKKNNGEFTAEYKSAVEVKSPDAFFGTSYHWSLGFMKIGKGSAKGLTGLFRNLYNDLQDDIDSHFGKK